MELSGQVVGLQNILSNKQARGAFGEIQLHDLVRDLLAPESYEFQAKVGNGRADCLLKLPHAAGADRHRCQISPGELSGAAIRRQRDRAHRARGAPSTRRCASM